MVGVASILVLRPGGFALTLFALIGTVVIYWVIDPKLKAVSAEYEQRQAKYLEELERGLQKAATGKPASGKKTAATPARKKKSAAKPD